MYPPYDIGITTLDGSAADEMLLQTSFSENNAQLSPDGTWLAYGSDESGRSEIYVRPFPAVKSGLQKVSTAGGSRPRWSRDGTELFYYVAPDIIMAVPVDTGAELVLGRPEVAVQGTHAIPLNTGIHYDVSADARRFLLIVDEDRPDGGASQPQITIVLNWLEELKRLVPVD